MGPEASRIATLYLHKRASAVPGGGSLSTRFCTAITTIAGREGYSPEEPPSRVQSEQRRIGCLGSHFTLFIVLAVMRIVGVLMPGT